MIPPLTEIAQLHHTASEKNPASAAARSMAPILKATTAHATRDFIGQCLGRTLGLSVFVGLAHASVHPIAFPLIAGGIGGPSNHGVVAIGQTVEAQTPDTLGIGRCGSTRGAIHFHGDLTARFGLALHPGLQITGKLVGIDQVAQQNTFDHCLIRGYRIDREPALGGCRTVASGVIRRDGNLPNTFV